MSRIAGGIEADGFRECGAEGVTGAKCEERKRGLEKMRRSEWYAFPNIIWIFKVIRMIWAGMLHVWRRI